MRRLVVLIALVPGLAWAQPAPAPAPDDVKAIHEHALALASAGNFADAVVELKRAIALDDQPKYECNLALALERLGELARAQARLSRCAPRLAAIDPTLVRPKLDKLALLEVELAKTHVAVRIEASAGVATATISAFPDDEIMNLPTTVWLAPGSYQLTVRFTGRRPPQTIAVETEAAEIGARRTVRVEQPAEAPAEVEAPIVVSAPMAPVAPPRSRRTAAVVMIGGGAAVAGGAVVHFLSRAPRDRLAGLSGAAYDAYAPTWHRYQYATIGLYGAGTVALGVGAYLFFRDHGSPLAVAPASGGDGAVVSWTLAR